MDSMLVVIASLGAGALCTGGLPIPCTRCALPIAATLETERLSFNHHAMRVASTHNTHTTPTIREIHLACCGSVEHGAVYAAR